MPSAQAEEIAVEHELTVFNHDHLALSEFAAGRAGRGGKRFAFLSTRRAKALVVLMDAFAIACAAFFAAAMATSLSAGERGQHLAVAIGSVPAWLVVFQNRRVYQSRFITRRTEEFRRLAQGVVGGVASTILVAYVTGVTMERHFVLTMATLSVPTLMVVREAARQQFRRIRRDGGLLRPAIIVGDNAEARTIQNLLAEPSHGYRVVGRVWVGDEPVLGKDLLGPVDDIVRIARRHGVGHVLIAASAIEVEFIGRLTRNLLNAGIHVELSPSLPDIASERLTVRTIGRFPVLYLEPFHQTGARSHFKRTFDIVAAFLALVLLAPVMALVAVAVRLDSPGPAIFRQARVGKNGRIFQVLKFRSMVANAEDLKADLVSQNEADGPLFKMERDPRVTRVGDFIRRTSLDELPQLWNVVRGDMSLVGPRPALPSETTGWSVDLHERLRVVPGITGMWQVNGRSSTSFEEYGRLDLYYVDNWSLVSDLAILCKTVPAVLKRNGAA